MLKCFFQPIITNPLKGKTSKFCIVFSFRHPILNSRPAVVTEDVMLYETRSYCFLFLKSAGRKRAFKKCPCLANLQYQMDPLLNPFFSRIHLVKSPFSPFKPSVYSHSSRPIRYFCRFLSCVLEQTRVYIPWQAAVFKLFASEQSEKSLRYQSLFFFQCENASQFG